MGVSLDPDGGGGGRNRSVDVELNLVPFIDMMSCLVAFLLITAVWSNLAQIPISPKGVGNAGLTGPPPDQLALLVSRDAVWVGRASGERVRIGAVGDEHDWVSLQTALREERADPSLAGRRDVEVAGEDGVTYQTIVSAMDVAIAAGFDEVKFVDPPGLAVQFRR